MKVIELVFWLFPDVQVPRIVILPITGNRRYVVLAVSLHYVLNSYLKWLVMILGSQRYVASPLTEQILSDLTVDLKTLGYAHT